MRQLYRSKVASKLDYAAPVWFQVEKQSTRAHKALEAIQKIRNAYIREMSKRLDGNIN